MQKGFNKLTEGIAWLQIVASPTLIGVVLGILAGLAGNGGLGIVIGVTGLIIGVLWATRVSKKEGAVRFISRAMATPELDGEESDIQKKSIENNTAEK
ncbi:hypothetical protein [Fluviicola chungangensis]|uniref:Uncharacterized protein n=1 Tax=Fluviicola chungangensis TaxID=2597671 RepID=A0A556N6Y3_9FLAO|nr:hypothetical protein [Fluviicola chungangensis]TSJ47937.1 hypothetical protein FO442_02050 [Fluviicola chungangensis]